MKQKNGTFQEFKDHTLAVVRGERRVDPSEPKVWIERIEGGTSDAGARHRRQGGEVGRGEPNPRPNRRLPRGS